MHFRGRRKFEFTSSKLIFQQQQSRSGFKFDLRATRRKPHNDQVRNTYPLLQARDPRDPL